MDAAPDERARSPLAPDRDRGPTIGDLLARIGNAAEILQAASEGIACLQKWVGVGRSIAHLMREARSIAATPSEAVPEAVASHALLASLVGQYNTLLAQIDSVARGASRNGVNLLNGDALTVAIDEAESSILMVGGAVCDAAGLGLAPLPARIDGQNTIDVRLTALQEAGSTLRAQAQTIASNLVLVQSRQQFYGNLIEVLPTGASGRPKASASEEAANSLALSTRQAIASSARALARESEASILRLLNRSNFFSRDGDTSS